MPRLNDRTREKIFQKLQENVPIKAIAIELKEEVDLPHEELINCIRSIKGQLKKGFSPRVLSKKEGQIYFIQGEKTKNIKIGFSEDPNLRLRGHQTGSGEKLDLLKAVKGQKADEVYLHKKFEVLRLHGEWFKPGKELLEYIYNL